MALFYSDKSAKKMQKQTAYTCFKIQDLDYQGLGVAKIHGKTWFVENALPSEEVQARIIEEKRQYGRAQAVKIVQKSAYRQLPYCPVYTECGGCKMQHISLDMQHQAKQNALFRRLQLLQESQIELQPMLVGSALGYRRRTRLSIAIQKGRLVVGFRRLNSQEVVPISECKVLVAELNQLLPSLLSVLHAWRFPKKLGHVELVKADNGVALLLRHMGKVEKEDRLQLLDFAQKEQLMLFVMCDENQVEHWYGAEPFYSVSGLELGFSMRDFIQVNAELNQKMVETALDWLALSGAERVLDLFCGMGNFTLPIAQYAKFVVGIEGVSAMVEQAYRNAERNKVENVEFYQTDLDQPFIDKSWATLSFDKVLLDPARQGALFALDHLCALKPSHIVYVSCNPATLVRDAEKLLSNGYRIVKTAMIDMFPHTGHLESITLFIKR